MRVFLFTTQFVYVIKGLVVKQSEVKIVRIFTKLRFWLMIFVLLIFFAINQIFFSSERITETEVSMGQFINEVINHPGLENVVIKKNADILTANFNEGNLWQNSDGKKFNVVTTIYTDGYEETITQILLDEGIVLEVENDNVGGGFMSYLPTILLYLLLFGGLIFILNRQQGAANKALNFGKTKSNISKEKPTVKFSDVAGLEETKEELREVKEFLENPKKFRDFGELKIPKGVLLYGPPGNGKTLLARAVAGEAGVSFFSISGSDFVEMFVGVGASRVRDLFEKAKEVAPSILFIDEIDAVGRHRGSGLGGGHDEREQTLNQLLVEMDGFDKTGDVIIMAATNRPDILDNALTRPGRFDRQVLVPAPNTKEREEILKLYARNLPIDQNVDFRKIAQQTYGFSGAGLENLINEAGLLCVRYGRLSVTMLEIEEAIEKVMLGTERKSFVLEKRDKQTVAYHEAGHAIVAYALEDAEELHKVTIVPRGRALGYTMTLPEKEKVLEYRNSLWAQLAMFLGGRAAEDILSDNPTGGITGDNAVATQIAEKMVKEYGMSRLGRRSFVNRDGPVLVGVNFGAQSPYSDAIAKQIDEEISYLIDDLAYGNARVILNEYIQELEALAQGLIESEEETLWHEQISEILEGTKLAKDKKKWKFNTASNTETGLAFLPL